MEIFDKHFFIYKMSYSDVNIFYADCSSIDIELAEKSVSKERLKKAEKLKRAEDKKLSLGVELLLSYAIKELYNIDHKTLEYATCENGKPYFKNLPDVHFSLSHSGKIAMCAISSLPVGCDCEMSHRKSEGIEKKYFNQMERDLLKNGKTFAHIWTRKEAVAKCNGRGVAAGLKKIDTTCDFLTFDGAKYRLITVPCALAGYDMAVCVSAELPDSR